ncbi:MAG: sigma-54 dependent transcriptional regulator, partial [Myxococcaceae bacterium]
SMRAEAPLVIVDCGAVAASVIESELFGHAKGAFTGAVANRNGAFLEADGGTLFLDEIGELPLEHQPKLLRVLETGTVKRVGEDRPRKVNVRVIAATHRNLRAEVEKGTFRRDLYFRLNVVPVHVPPLRERTEDLPVLTHAILGQLQRTDFEVSEELLERFRAYHWPGNVRELRNVIERAVSGGGSELEPDPAWSGDGQQPAPSANAGLADLPFKEAKDRLVEGFTREYLETLFRKHGGNVSAVARAAGIARNHVYNLLTRYGLGGPTS